MAIEVSYHVLERISERAGVSISRDDVLALIPEQDLARMEAGATVYVKAKRLAMDLVCRDRTITTGMHYHAWRTLGPRVPDYEWRLGYDRRPDEARTRQACFDADEDLVVGGRVRRVEA